MELVKNCWQLQKNSLQAFRTRSFWVLRTVFGLFLHSTKLQIFDLLSTTLNRMLAMHRQHFQLSPCHDWNLAPDNWLNCCDRFGWPKPMCNCWCQRSRLYCVFCRFRQQWIEVTAIVWILLASTWPILCRSSLVGSRHSLRILDERTNQAVFLVRRRTYFNRRIESTFHFLFYF